MTFKTFADLGRLLTNWGPDHQTQKNTVHEIIKNLSEERMRVSLLAAILEEQQRLRVEIASLPRKIGEQISKAEEKICKAREKAAKAELIAKQENPQVTVIQCSREIMDMIPQNRLRGKW